MDAGEVIVNITLDASPTPVITIERMNGIAIPNMDTRVIIGAGTIVLRNLTCDDAGTYIVTVTNAAGNQMATFDLCEFELYCANCALPVYSHVQYIYSYIHTYVSDNVHTCVCMEIHYQFRYKQRKSHTSV